MSGQADPTFAYVMLRRADPDPVAGFATADINGMSAKPGPPATVPWAPKPHPDPKLQPGDLYDGMQVQMAARRLKTEPAIVAIMSQALHARLDARLPGTTKTIPVRLVGADGAMLDYVGVSPLASLEARPAAQALPGDLQWATVAFAVAEAPAAVFTLRSKAGGQLVLERSIAESLGVTAFRDVRLSAFHATPASGGARPATAALGRILEGTERPDDHATVVAALRNKDP